MARVDPAFSMAIVRRLREAPSRDRPRAPVAELVDALDSKSSSARSAGSIPARGTKPKISIITIAYTIGLIPHYQENFRGALKTRVKIHCSCPVCWHFCWYLRKRRIPLFRTRELSRWPQERWRGRQPEHVDCSATLPKFDKGASAQLRSLSNGRFKSGSCNESYFDITQSTTHDRSRGPHMDAGRVVMEVWWASTLRAQA